MKSGEIEWGKRSRIADYVFIAPCFQRAKVINNH